MFDETTKDAYRSTVPPEGMKDRIMAACRTARSVRKRREKQFASLAACLVLVLGLSFYGFSPVPGVSSGGQVLTEGSMAVVRETVTVSSGPQSREAVAWTAEAGGEEAEEKSCIPLMIDRAASVQVSEGTLYLFDPLLGSALELGASADAEAGAQLYWQCDTEGAELKVRSGVRSVTLHLGQTDGVWQLYQ